LIFHDTGKTEQVWLYCYNINSRNKRAELRFGVNQDVERLYQRASGLIFELDEQDNITIVDVTARVRGNFAANAEKVTKRFYDARAGMKKTLSVMAISLLATTVWLFAPQPAVAASQQESEGNMQSTPAYADGDAWKNNRIYLGAGFGFERAAWTQNNAGVASTWFAVGGTADFALTKFLSVEIMLGLDMDLEGKSNISVLPFMPIMAKLGRRFAKIELSADAGYTTCAGFSVGGTFGIKAGRGILFAKIHAIPVGSPPSGYSFDNSVAGFLGYKVGVGGKRK
jgi:hypothetical protein